MKIKYLLLLLIFLTYTIRSFTQNDTKDTLNIYNEIKGDYMIYIEKLSIEEPFEIDIENNILLFKKTKNKNDIELNPIDLNNLKFKLIYPKSKDYLTFYRNENGIISSFELVADKIKYAGKKVNNKPKAVSKAKREFSIETLEAEFTPYCKKIISNYNIPGMAVGIVKNDKIIYAEAFGYQNIETKKPITTTSLFHMASVSKPFVATAIMQLVEKQKINLDSTVTTYLPYFKLKGELYDQITIRQMLSHVSGMPDVHDYEWDNPVYDAGALEKYVRSISSEEMIAAPGEKYAYSNIAYECLGDVIAKVSGTSFADYVKENILNPAGMKVSTFLKPENLPENWAAPHIRLTSLQLWDVYPYNRMHGPSSTLHSNVLEMCNWAIINMDRGTYKRSTILDSSSYDLLWRPQFKDNPVGLSWFLEEYKDEATVGHGGGDTGFNTAFVMLPDKSMAVVVLCNLSPAPVYMIRNAALDILLGYEPATFKKPAFIPIGMELEQKGVDAAIKMWKSLLNEHQEEYDFNAELIPAFENALEMDRPREAVMLAEFLAELMGDEQIKPFKEELEPFLQEMPDNDALPAVLKVLEKKINSIEE